MLDKQTILNELPGFTGTIDYHQWSRLYPNFVLTDGAKYLADSASAYWLMDLIGSYQAKLLRKGQAWQAWYLTVWPDQSAKIWCTNGNKHILAKQEIPYTDFPLDTIRLFAIKDDQYLVIMLPGEY